MRLRAFINEEMTDIRSKKVFDFLGLIAEHNDRDWFHANRALYDEAAAAFSEMVAGLIARISEFEPGVASLSPRDCTYRIYRDLRFTADKSPYKTHMAAYINPHGKKSLLGGYYFHIEPGQSMAAGGTYYIPPRALRAVRQSICDGIEEFRGIVEAPAFVKRFGHDLGMQRLKTVPQGFPKDYPFIDYLRPKDYSVWESFSDERLLSEGWEDEVVKSFREMKPLIDFVNYTMEDYI